MDVEKELKDLKRRVDLAETRLSQLEGRFEFISGQLCLRHDFPEVVANIVGAARRERG